jgi:hypothetical protein
MVEPSVLRCCCRWNGWYIDPFALCQDFPGALGGRDSTDYYGSAAPVVTLVICPPTLTRVTTGSGVARIAIYLSAVGTFPKSLYPASRVGKHILADEWSLRLLNFSCPKN